MPMAMNPMQSQQVAAMYGHHHPGLLAMQGQPGQPTGYPMPGQMQFGGPYQQCVHHHSITVFLDGHTGCLACH